MAGMKKKITSRQHREAQQATLSVNGETELDPMAQERAEAERFAFRYLEDDNFSALFDLALEEALATEKDRFDTLKAEHEARIGKIAKRLGRKSEFQEAVEADKAKPKRTRKASAGGFDLDAMTAELIAVLKKSGGPMSSGEARSGLSAEINGNQWARIQDTLIASKRIAKEGNPPRGIKLTFLK
jgi:hypothetical protein